MTRGAVHRHGVLYIAPGTAVLCLFAYTATDHLHHAHSQPDVDGTGSVEVDDVD